MSTEECAFCGEDTKPWAEAKGHFCFDCFMLSEQCKNKTNNEELLKDSYSNESRFCKL